MSSVGLVMMVVLATAGVERGSGVTLGEFRWGYGEAVVQAAAAGGLEWVSVKDPSIVRHGERRHLFCTVRGLKRSHAIVYLSFADRQGKPCGQIPWKLGLLEPAR